MTKRMKIIFSLFILFGIIGFGILIFYGFKQNGPRPDWPHDMINKKTGEVINTYSSVPGDPKDWDILGWTVYRNEKYGFHFDYPMGWKISTDKNDVVAISGNIYEIKVSALTGEELTDFKRVRGIAFCEANPKDQMCESIERDGLYILITYLKDNSASIIISSKEREIEIGMTIKPTTREKSILMKEITYSFGLDPSSEESRVCPAPHYQSPQCPKVITKAKNIKTGEVKEFSDGCLPLCWVETK